MQSREYGFVQSQIFNTEDLPKPFLQSEWPNPVLAIHTREFGSVQAQVFNTADVPVIATYGYIGGYTIIKKLTRLN